MPRPLRELGILATEFLDLRHQYWQRSLEMPPIDRDREPLVQLVAHDACFHVKTIKRPVGEYVVHRAKIQLSGDLGFHKRNAHTEEGAVRAGRPFGNIFVRKMIPGAFDDVVGPIQRVEASQARQVEIDAGAHGTEAAEIARGPAQTAKIREREEGQDVFRDDLSGQFQEHIVGTATESRRGRGHHGKTTSQCSTSAANLCDVGQFRRPAFRLPDHLKTRHVSRAATEYHIAPRCRSRRNSLRLR